MPRRERKLEKGQEYCPISSKLNFPGDYDTCGHHVALVWDGQITWQIDEMRTLINAWQELADVRYAFEEREHDFDVLVGPICEKPHISREAVDKLVETEKLSNGMEIGIHVYLIRSPCQDSRESSRDRLA